MKIAPSMDAYASHPAIEPLLVHGGRFRAPEGAISSPPRTLGVTLAHVETVLRGGSAAHPGRASRLASTWGSQALRAHEPAMTPCEARSFIRAVTGGVGRHTLG